MQRVIVETLGREVTLTTLYMATFFLVLAALEALALGLNWAA
jgi:hypothetical protein